MYLFIFKILAKLLIEYNFLNNGYCIVIFTHRYLPQRTLVRHPSLKIAANVSANTNRVVRSFLITCSLKKEVCQEGTEKKKKKKEKKSEYSVRNSSVDWLESSRRIEHQSVQRVYGVNGFHVVRSKCRRSFCVYVYYITSVGFASRIAAHIGTLDSKFYVASRPHRGYIHTHTCTTHTYIIFYVHIGASSYFVHDCSLQP